MAVDSSLGPTPALPVLTRWRVVEVVVIYTQAGLAAMKAFYAILSVEIQVFGKRCHKFDLIRKPLGQIVLSELQY